MPLLPPPWFQDPAVRKNYEIVAVGLTVYDQGAEGTSIDFKYIYLGLFSFHDCHLDPRLSF